MGPSNPKLNMKSLTAKLEDKQNQLLLNHITAKDFFPPSGLHLQKVKKMNVTTHASKCSAFGMLAWVVAMISLIFALSVLHLCNVFCCV